MSDVENVMSAAAEVDAFFRAKGWQFCFIGGIAVQRWGKPRFTQDVDLTLLTGLDAGQFIQAVLERFPARIKDAADFAARHRVVLARTAGGVDLDIALGAMPFEEASVGRASVWSANGAIQLTTCSAEDLVVHKVFAGRDRDWSDVESVLARQHGRLALPQIRRDLQPLLELKEDSTSLGKFEHLAEVVNGRSGS